MDTQTAPPPSRRSAISDEVAYWLPMATFLSLIGVGSISKSLYPWTYLARTVLAAALLITLRRHYTKIRWNYWWLGLVVGVVGIAQWIGMQLWLQHHFAMFRPGPDSYDPFAEFHAPAAVWGFIAVRVFDAVCVVPFMEELFWRDWLWRQVLAPNDFKLAKVGEWGWAPFLVVAVAFGTVHGNWWLSAIVWAMLIGAMLVWTKSLGACIVAHSVANLLLAAYVLKTHDWSFW